MRKSSVTKYTLHLSQEELDKIVRDASRISDVTGLPLYQAFPMLYQLYEMLLGSVSK